MMKTAASLALLTVFVLIGGCAPPASGGEHATAEASFEVRKTDAQWREQLTEQEYAVLRKKSTERAFTGDLLRNDREGIYTCAGCGQHVFSSASKFDSGTGWPSYHTPIDSGVATTTDRSWGMTRTEVHCSRCGGHLGHVFTDGPAPTGLRYCINSAALDFKPRSAVSTAPAP